MLVPMNTGDQEGGVPGTMNLNPPPPVYAPDLLEHFLRFVSAGVI